VGASSPHPAFKREPDPFTASPTALPAPFPLASPAPTARQQPTGVPSAPPHRPSSPSRLDSVFPLDELRLAPLFLPMLSFSCLVASRAVFASSSEPPPRPAMASAAPSLPRPRKRHGRGRHHLLFTPKLPFLQMRHCSARARNAGELHAAAMAAPPSPPPTPVSNPPSLVYSRNTHSHFENIVSSV
jgi:hypothetical protein